MITPEQLEAIRERDMREWIGSPHLSPNHLQAIDDRHWLLKSLNRAVYVVIIEDRHADVDVEVYTDEMTAVDRAVELAGEYNYHPEDIEAVELSEGAIKDGWLVAIRYSPESDWVRVVKRELNES